MAGELREGHAIHVDAHDEETWKACASRCSPLKFSSLLQKASFMAWRCFAKGLTNAYDSLPKHLAQCELSPG